MKISQPPIVVEQIFNKPLEVVWNAITRLDQMTQWFFNNIPEFKAETGFKVQFNVQAPSRDFLHLWEITEVIPFQKLVCNWKYQDLEGESYVTFQLLEEDSKTKLILTTKVVADFDDAIPEFRRESCQGGWNYFIKDSLVNFLK